MPRIIPLVLVLSISLAAGFPALADDADPKKSPAGKAGEKSAEERPEILAGHSAHGEAFNEGARQKAYLMQGTGQVMLPVTTTSPLAQQFVNQGVGQLHGFWYFEAERSFRQAAAIDPDCAMAYWGMAMANKNNIKRGKGFIAEAVKRKKLVTEREGMYIDALNAYINPTGKARTNRARKLAHDFAAIAKKYPDDIEAQAFYGLYLYSSRNLKPRLKYEDVDKELRKVLAVNPMHPCHHYIIHLWDYKDAAKALPSAARCGQAAPAIAHMWHMPGHIYSRLKRYRDAAWQQEASARVDHAHMIRDRVLPDQIHNFAHNNEWLIRNLINIGRMHDAVDLARNMIELPRHPKYNTLSRRGSTFYGRYRLFLALSYYELWDELIALAETPYLEPTDKPDEQVKRLQYLARAYFAKGETDKALRFLSRFEGDLKKQQAARAAAVKKAEDAFRKTRKLDNKKKLSAALRRQLNTAKTNAGRPFDTRIRSLQAAVNELKGRKALAGKDYKNGLSQVRRAGLPQWEIAQIQLLSGDKKAAETTLRNYLKSHKNEVLPLAHLVYVLWKAGKTDDAKKEFGELRIVAGEADLDAPILKRLAPLAAELKWPKDWRTPQPRPKDFGTRPPLDKLGPFRWHPYKAADWALKDVKGKVHSLKDYRGKPVIVIFYLGYGCLHCAEQLQAFAPKTAKFRKAGYELIAISTDNQQQLKQSHDNYRKGKFPFPLVSDAKLDIFKQYRCYDDFEKTSLHGTFVIDAQGLVRWQDISYEPFMDPEFVLKEANRLLQQSTVSAAVKKQTKPASESGDTGGPSGE